MKERAKDVIGRPKWWLINGVAIVLFITAVAVLWPEDSKAAPVSPASSSQVEQSERIICNKECQRFFAKKKVRQFKKDKLGNAKGFRLPKNIRIRLDKKQGQAAGFSGKFISDDDWWDYPGQVFSCLAYGGMTASCDRASDIRDDIEKKTTKLAIVCGGSALIGFLGKGGWWGLGRGAAGCLWTKFIGAW